MKAIYDAENNEKLGVIARETYDKTLAEYHSWIIKTSARVAMQFLPTRAELLNKVKLFPSFKQHYKLIFN